MISYHRGMLAKYKHDRREIKRRKNKKSEDPIWYDNIFCFDIETTSAFITPDERVISYDYSLPESYYAECQKIGILYHWQFGIEYDEDIHVFAGRDWESLKDFISELNELYPHNKQIWVHNLSHEFHFLCNILGWESVFARRPHKVLTADVGSLHFRCSYFLVNMSLEKWAEQKRLPVTKATGQLQYDVLRTPFSDLSPQELDYCERDILVMYEGLKPYREKYGSIHKIPLTQTGEIRLVLQKVTEKEYNLKKKNVQLIPNNLNDYMFYMGAFGGGDVHANYIHSDTLLHNVHSADIASSYPWAMISEDFIVAPPVPVTVDPERFMNSKFFHYFICFEAWDIECKLFNTFLSLSRCHKAKDYKLDNGRIMKAGYVLCTMYKWDFEMFREFYQIRQLHILEVRVAPVRPMNNVLRKQIIEMYKDKTQLKGIEEFYDTYIFKKQLVNGIYGDFVQRQFEDQTVYKNNTWQVERVDEEKYMDIYRRKCKQGYKMYKNMLTGIAIPSAARRNLWRGIIAPLDQKIVYFDTDSGKWLGNDNGTVSSYNISVLLKHQKIADQLGIPVTDLSPVDPDGVAHPIGCFEHETGPTGYKDFKTLGAKKYAVLEWDKKKQAEVVKITIAGVPKKNADLLSSVDDLNDELYFGPDKCGKNILYYQTEQPEVTFPDGYVSKERFGICFQPTGYKVGLSMEYLSLLLANKNMHDHQFDTILQYIDDNGRINESDL